MVRPANLIISPRIAYLIHQLRYRGDFEKTICIEVRTNTRHKSFRSCRNMNNKCHQFNCVSILLPFALSHSSAVRQQFSSSGRPVARKLSPWEYLIQVGQPIFMQNQFVHLSAPTHHHFHRYSQTSPVQLTTSWIPITTSFFVYSFLLTLLRAVRLSTKISSIKNNSKLTYDCATTC